MKQQDEIEQQKEFIATKKQELAELEKTFKEKYGEVQKKIDELEKKIEKVYQKETKMKITLVTVLSDEPERFIEGSSHLLNKELLDMDSDHILRDIVWGKYHEFMANSPEFQKIEKERVALRHLKWGFEDENGYQKIKEKIDNLKNIIKSRIELVEDLKDIGYFRRYAREKKEQLEDDEQIKNRNEKKKLLTALFDAKYAQKMKDAIASFKDED